MLSGSLKQRCAQASLACIQACCRQREEISNAVRQSRVEQPRLPLHAYKPAVCWEQGKKKRWQQVVQHRGVPKFSMHTYKLLAFAHTCSRML